MLTLLLPLTQKGCNDALYIYTDRESCADGDTHCGFALCGKDKTRTLRPVRDFVSI